MPNQQVALVADLSELYVETTDLTEMDVVKVKEGDSARIKPDALSDLSLPATVTEISQDSGKKGGDVTYKVRLKLDSTDPRLRWGMTVEVRFTK
jgi:multidrug resistance efflux pump